MPLTGDEASRVALVAPEAGVSIVTPMGVRSFRAMGGASMSTVGGFTDGEQTAIPGPNRPREVSFQADWVADGWDDDLRPVLEDLWRLNEQIPKLRRKPIVYCSYGGVEVIQEGWISKLDVEYLHGVHDVHSPVADELFRLLDINLLGEKSIRMFRADITIVRAQQRSFAVTGEKRQRETKYRRLAAGETFESVAMAEYGDPYRGITLRTINPRVAVDGERVGDTLKVFEPSHPTMKKPVGPRSPGYGDGWPDVVQARAEATLETRGKGLAALESELGL